MSAIVQMGGVVAAAALKVDRPKGIVIGGDVALACGIEYRYAVTSAYLDGGIDHLFRIAALEILASPACKEKDSRFRVFLNKALAQYG